MENRRSGVLLHITSLPSLYGIGDLGPEAYRFVDFLFASGQHYWQILPLTSTNPALGNSPYSSFSVFGGNPLLISPQLLIEDGFIRQQDLEFSDVFPEDKVLYEKVRIFKDKILEQAYQNHKYRIMKDADFNIFCEENAYWLEDHSLFVALKLKFEDKPWKKWPQEIRDREKQTLKKIRKDLEENILIEKFRQYLFHKQWRALRQYCQQKNIEIIGDLPIYVHYDSVDVWANPKIFKLDENKLPTFVSGVPPDYFSAKGQLWRNPVYDWDYLKKTDYAWWKARFKKNFHDCDVLRVDHFRGFVAFWEVERHRRTAITGAWVNAPAEDFFNALISYFKQFPIIAEDLGIITDDVKAVMKKFGFPGMRLLLFGFEEDDKGNMNAPHNLIENCIVYTGTHDNNTVRGWFEHEATEKHKLKLKKVLKKELVLETIHWDLIDLAMTSVARTVVIPLQDILGLDSSARMNTPSTKKDNWLWRLRSGALTSEISLKLLEATKKGNRV